MQLLAFLLLFLSFLPINAEVVDLSQYEKKIYSQNGEDGIALKLFELFSPVSKYYVEFGGYDGYIYCNTRYFREHKGWRGLLLDGSHENLSINLQKEFITAENINYLFEKYQVPYDLDLLVIDINYNDFYVWKAIDEKYKPKVIIIEYNATHLPHEDKVVYYDPIFMWDGSNYYGASILALYRLGKKKGYSLVYAERRAVNLFFVRDDLITQSGIDFKDVNDVIKLYQTPNYGIGPNGGHPQDRYNRPYLASYEIE